MNEKYNVQEIGTIDIEFVVQEESHMTECKVMRICMNIIVINITIE